MEIKTVMVKSDFSGDYTNTGDCPGYRSFKRVCENNLPWRVRFFMSYRWLFYKSCSGKWRAYKNDSPVNMNKHARVGDIITFKKGFKR